MHPKCLQASQHRMCPFWIAHERAFRDLKRQAARGELICQEEVGHVAEKLGVVERAGREIDRYIHEEPCLRPVAALPYCSLKYPIRQRTYEPGTLGQWHELIGWHKAMHLVWPPDGRL